MKPVLTLNSLARFEDPSYDYSNKKQFCKEGKAFLKSLAYALELPAGEFTIGYAEGGIGVPGDITLRSTHLYATISHYASSPGVMILFRTCNGQRDCTGHANHWINPTHLQNIENQEKWIKTLRSMIAKVAHSLKANSNLGSYYPQPHLAGPA